MDIMEAVSISPPPWICVLKMPKTGYRATIPLWRRIPQRELTSPGGLGCLECIDGGLAVPE